MIPMFASCTLLWGLMKPHILGVPDEKQAQPQPKKTPDLGIKDKVNIFKVCLMFFALIRKQLKPSGNPTKMSKWPRSTCVEFRTSWQCVPLACSILIKSGNSCTAHYYPFTLFNSVTSNGFILGIQQGLSFMLAN